MNIYTQKELFRIRKHVKQITNNQIADLDIDIDTGTVQINVCLNDGWWQHGQYSFTLDFTPYPEAPPKIKCNSSTIIHPNIESTTESGQICLNLLDEWGEYEISATQVFLGILFLFYQPNFEDPLSYYSYEYDADFPDECEYKTAILEEVQSQIRLRHQEKVAIQQISTQIVTEALEKVYRQVWYYEDDS